MGVRSEFTEFNTYPSIYFLAFNFHRGKMKLGAPSVKNGSWTLITGNRSKCEWNSETKLSELYIFALFFQSYFQLKRKCSPHSWQLFSRNSLFKANVLTAWDFHFWISQTGVKLKISSCFLRMRHRKWMEMEFGTKTHTVLKWLIKDPIVADENGIFTHADVLEHLVQGASWRWFAFFPFAFGIDAAHTEWNIKILLKSHEFARKNDCL